MTAASAPLRLLVVDDDELLREVLAEVLSQDDGLEVVAVAGDTETAIREGGRTRPDLALVDVRMPDGGGPKIARELRRVSPATKVVALSSHDDRGSIAEMFRAGAVSYLVKGEATNEDIVSTLFRVSRGELAVPSSVGWQLLDELTSRLEVGHTEEEGRRGAEARVRRVLAAGRVPMVYQPIVDLDDGCRRGLEALARFPGPPTRSPDVWFADAALVGLAVELELLAVRSAIDALDGLDDDAYLAINVSPVTAGDPGFQALLLGSSPSSTVVEITEHAPIVDYEGFARAIEPLRSAGVRFAVDDAGAGFASLRHIVLLAPEVIKLDLSLTRGVDGDRGRRAMARALISFAAEMEATVVAEGIETAAELKALRGLGILVGQGYFLGRPAPLRELAPGCAGRQPR